MTPEKHTVDRREQILASAARVFRTSGYAEATIDAVAAEAGIAKGSVYNYFKSKQDLFVDVFVSSFSYDEEEVVARLAKLPSALAKVDMVFDEWFKRFSKYAEEGALVLEFWLVAARQGEGVMTEAFRNLYMRWRQKLSTIIAEGVASGEVRANVYPQTAAAVIMATLDGLILQSILGVGVIVDEKLHRRLKRGFRAALTAEPDKEEQVEVKE